MSVPFTFSEPYVYSGDTVVAINDGKSTWIQMEEMVNELPNLYNMEIRKDDVWVIGYPKSGNTWAAEMLYCICHGDTKYASKTSYFDRICWPEMRAYHRLGTRNRPEEERKKIVFRESFKQTVECKSPRVIRCHLPISLLSPKLLDTARVIYLCRNLKDCAVSFYKMLDGTGIMEVPDLDHFIDEFMEDKGMCHPVCQQIKECWEKRHHPNMYFLFFEDMKKDLANEMRKLAAFLGTSLTEEKIKELEEYLSVESMRKNKNVDMHEFIDMGIMGEKQSFIRKGVAGDWKNYFSPATEEKWNKWINENFAGTGFKFRE